MKTNWDASEKHLSGQLDQMVRHSVRMHFYKMSYPRAYQRCWPIGCTVHAAVHKRVSHSRSCCAVWCYWRAARPMKKSSKFNKLSCSNHCYSTYYKLVWHTHNTPLYVNLHSIDECLSKYVRISYKIGNKKLSKQRKSIATPGLLVCPSFMHYHLSQ